VCLGLGELVAVAIEMDELPAGDLPAGIGGDGDQGVAAGVIADRSRIGRCVRRAVTRERIYCVIFLVVAPELVAIADGRRQRRQRSRLAPRH
jgi:hypothetical protein